MPLTRRNLLLAAPFGAAAFAAAPDGREWRARVRSTLFVPDPLPDLEPETHGRFAPAPGVMAERVSFRSQFGLRVPAILYLPEKHAGKLPALTVVAGHGGDKYSWYAYYAGILYARAGAAVLTYDQPGEGERNLERKSGTRAHDRLLEPVEEMGRRMNGLMVTDLMQSVSLLAQHPAVDRSRIGALGHSMGSFVLALGGALETRLRACVLSGGGNLDGPGEYWDGSKKMCQSVAYRSLMFLGDRAAAIYWLHADRGATLVLNGLEDAVVAIRPDARAFFEDLRARTIRLGASPARVFEYGLTPRAGHRPYFLTRPAALWLERQLDFAHWRRQDIERMAETRAGDWARATGVPMESHVESGHAGTPCLGSGLPGFEREQLSILAAPEWERRKREFILEEWIARVRREVRTP